MSAPSAWGGTIPTPHLPSPQAIRGAYVPAVLPTPHTPITGPIVVPTQQEVIRDLPQGSLACSAAGATAQPPPCISGVPRG